MKKSRRRNKPGKNRVIRIITFLLVAATIVTLGIRYLQNKVSEEYAEEPKDTVIQGTATRGSISTSVYGSGMLSDDDVEKLEILEGIELEKIYVQPGDIVEEGALLATVDTNSAMAAMVSLSDELSQLDSQINSASLETAENLIKSSINGRVKAVFVNKGDDVADVMMEKGALMLLSLDGYMAVDIPAGELSEKESVYVLTAQGQYPASVGKIIGDKATVLVTDVGTNYAEHVTVLNMQGAELGSGELYIHDPLKVIGYTGTVNYIWAKENAQVFSGSSLIELVNQSYTVNLDALLVERRELEDKMEQLIGFYRQGAIYAPFGGTVKEVEATDAQSEETEEESEALETMYISISPDETMSVSVSVDETNILSLSAGQQALVTINSLGEEQYSGTVTEIDRIGTSSSGVTVYTATVSIAKQSGMLSGMSASTAIEIDGVDNALLIPVDALQKTSSSYFVYTSYDETSGTLGGIKEVTIGISNADYVEISSGLSDGDVVYYVEVEEQMSFFMPGGSGGRAEMNFGGGGMPGGMSGGMPGEMPGGSMPSGGMPGGGMPGGR